RSQNKGQNVGVCRSFSAQGRNLAAFATRRRKQLQSRSRGGMEVGPQPSDARQSRITLAVRRVADQNGVVDRTHAQARANLCKAVLRHREKLAYASPSSRHSRRRTSGGLLTLLARRQVAQ